VICHFGISRIIHNECIHWCGFSTVDLEEDDYESVEGMNKRVASACAPVNQSTDQPHFPATVGEQQMDKATPQSHVGNTLETGCVLLFDYILF